MERKMRRGGRDMPRSIASPWRFVPSWRPFDRGVSPPKPPSIYRELHSRPPDLLSSLCLSELPSVPGYRILSVVGRGAMATVYRAEHERLKKTVALKVMDPVVAED